LPSRGGYPNHCSMSWQEPAFRISEGAKEFFVRFDTIMS
jgi:hypothetical protein